MRQKKVSKQRKGSIQERSADKRRDGRPGCNTRSYHGDDLSFCRIIPFSFCFSTSRLHLWFSFDLTRCSSPSCASAVRLDHIKHIFQRWFLNIILFRCRHSSHNHLTSILYLPAWRSSTFATKDTSSENTSLYPDCTKTNTTKSVQRVLKPHLPQVLALVVPTAARSRRVLSCISFFVFIFCIFVLFW